MAVHLEIIWDGEVPGLPDHRLSLDAFGPALHQLLAAIRRIASDIQLQAEGPTRGRLAREAANLDVQIETIRANSPVTLEAQIVPLAPPNRPLIADLSERALETFLRDVERESAGYPSHYKARKFLGSLPDGLTRQTYRQKSADGQVLRSVEIERMHLPVTAPSPHLIEFHGLLVGFGFEPGRQEIKVRLGSGGLVTLSASQEQVDAALAMRLVEIDVLAVAEPSKMRLLRFTTAEFTPPSAVEREAFVFGTWSGLLNRLAQ